MVQWLRLSTVLAEDSSLVLCTHTEWSAWNSGSRVSDSLLDSAEHLYSQLCIPMYRRRGS